MTMKRILHCTLMFVVLVTSGCDFLSSDTGAPQNTNSQPSPQVEKNEIDFTRAAQDVGNAVTKLKAPTNTTVKQVKEDITDAIQKLGRDENDIVNRCGDCPDQIRSGAVGVWRILTAKSNSLGRDPQKEIRDFDEDFRKNLQQDLTNQAAKLTELSTAESTSAVNPSPSPPVVQVEPSQHGNADDPWWWSTLVLALQIVGGLLALVLFVSALTYLWKRAWKAVEFNVGQVVAGHLAATRDAQPDYAAKLSSLSSAQSDMSNRLTELDTEVRSLSRLVRESLATRRYDRNPSYDSFNNYQSRSDEVAPKDEPEFPVSAVDYLGKMNRFANVVRPDFQNGILVNDPGGDGELVLIRDSRDDTQPLFVVPRATQFQTKQDFYTYYQKYYDCARPSAGDVWIVGPAVVEKVTGGWQLREKGMLEIR